RFGRGWRRFSKEGRMSDASNTQKSGATRRGMMAGAAALAPMLAAGGADAATPNRAALVRAVENGKEAAIARIRDWIAHPTIAAQHLNVPEGAQYMLQLARAAGSQTAEIVQTDGSPGVFATWNVGAAKTLGVYFMYDVKQFDPAEWTSPPLEARLV